MNKQAVESKNRVDLHIHTTASDGQLHPTEVVELAKSKGLGAIAITDHDTVSGIDEAMEAGRKLGVIVIPGVEISTALEGKEIHILGYGFDWQEERFLANLQQQRRVRDIRNELIIRKLNDLGITISLDDVNETIRASVASAENADGEQSSAEQSIGRPHIAQTLVRLGVVEHMQAAFNLYLAEGAAAYADAPRVTPQEAMDWITQAGGSAVIAHPGLYKHDNLIHDMLASGKAQGLEVYHSEHALEEEERYNDLAKRYNVVATGGSDFHGNRAGEAYHGDLGSKTVEIAVINKLWKIKK